MCDGAGAGASAAAEDRESAAAPEVVSPRSCEGDSSSSQAAPCPNSSSLEVGDLEEEPCHPPANQSGFQLAWLSSHMGHRSQGFIGVCSTSLAGTDLLGAAWCLKVVQTQVSVKQTCKTGLMYLQIISTELQLSPCYDLVQMCEEEARPRAPAGPDNDQPAAGTGTVQANIAEGGARGSLAASLLHSSLLRVGSLPQCVPSSVPFHSTFTQHSTAVRLVPHSPAECQK